MFELLIVIGLVLIVIGIVISLPFLGLGMIIPGIGDIADIAIGGLLVLAGTILIVIGVSIATIIHYWWIALLVIGFLWLLWGTMAYFKKKKVIK